MSCMTLHTDAHPLLDPFNLLSHRDTHITTVDGATFSVSRVLLAAASPALGQMMAEASQDTSSVEGVTHIHMECHSAVVQVRHDWQLNC